MCIKVTNKSLNILLLSADSFVNITQKVPKTEKYYFVIKVTFLFYLLLLPFPTPYHLFFQ